MGYPEDYSLCSVSVLGTRQGEWRNRERRRLVGSLSCFLTGMAYDFTKCYLLELVVGIQGQLSVGG